MCLKADNFSSEIDALVAPSELPLFAYDEIGHLTRRPYLFVIAQIRNTAGNSREHVFSKHDVCEDG